MSNSILKLYCKNCGHYVEAIYEKKIFKNNTTHIEALCLDCGSHIQYMPQGEDKLHFGKYKGMTIEEISERDLPYLEWLVNQTWCKNNLINKIKKYV